MVNASFVLDWSEGDAVGRTLLQNVILAGGKRDPEVLAETFPLRGGGGSAADGGAAATDGAPVENKSSENDDGDDDNDDDDDDDEEQVTSTTDASKESARRVAFLLRHSCDPSCSCEAGLTPLHVAVLMGNRAVVKLLAGESSSHHALCWLCMIILSYWLVREGGRGYILVNVMMMWVRVCRVCE
jgi:hypothetical protein